MFMLIFLDESGDTGQVTKKGSSSLFIVSIIKFKDRIEAERCDKAIDECRNKLSLPNDYEFHYSRNSDRVRNAFINVIKNYNFKAVTICIDKNPDVLYGEGFKNKDSFYKYACRLLLMSSPSGIVNATLVIDKSGSGSFEYSLKKYLNNNTELANMGISFKKIKQQKSDKNNLLQLADYFASCTNRAIRGNKKSIKDYKEIAKKNKIKVFPKQSPFYNKKI